jgi:O-antigen/teichoic acid export membrane protein
MDEREVDAAVTARAETIAAIASGRRLARNILWSVVDPVAKAVVGIALAGFVAHQLGVTGYGEISFAVSFVALFGVIANVGLNEVLVRAVARTPGETAVLWSSVLTAKVGLFAVYIAAVSVVAWMLGYSTSLVLVIVVMGAAQGLISIENTSASVLTGRQEMRPTAGLGVLRTFGEAAITVTVLLLGMKTLGLASSKVFIAIVAAAGSFLYTMKRSRLRFARPSMAVVRPLIIAGVSFATMTVIRSAEARGGILLLQHARGLDAIALFAVAMMPIERLLVLLASIQSALFPFFASLRDDTRERFGAALARAFRYQFLIALALGLFVAIAGPWGVRLIFPREFHGAVPIVQLLALDLTLRALNGLLNTVALAAGHERSLTWILGAQCVVNLGTAAALVGPFGALGLALAIAIGDGAALVLLAILLQRRRALPSLRWSPMVGAALVTAAIVIALNVIPGMSAGLIVTLATIGAYPLLLFAAGVVSHDDLKYLGGLLARERNV